MEKAGEIRVGTAGWSIPRPYAEWFPPTGSHLERYAARFAAVEINSSFYSFHKTETYARWAESVPEDFRFSVKLSRQITHEGRLKDLRRLAEFMQGPLALGKKLGALLVQLPPGLPFNAGDVASFFEHLRDLFAGSLVCEPRNPGWFRPEVEALLARYEAARAAVDPQPAPEAAAPGGWGGVNYYRLHGSPRMYYTPYSEEQLDALLPRLVTHSRSALTWCIFDNSAAFAATANALSLWEKVKRL